jgi:hypothetical protein
VPRRAFLAVLSDGKVAILNRATFFLSSQGLYSSDSGRYAINTIFVLHRANRHYHDLKIMVFATCRMLPFSQISNIDHVYFSCTMYDRGGVSLVNQTTPSTALDVLHHQHAEGGSGHSGTVFVTHGGM